MKKREVRYVCKVCVGCLLFAILTFCASQKTNGSSLLNAPIGKRTSQLFLNISGNYLSVFNNSSNYDSGSGSGSSNNEGALATASDPGSVVLARFEDLRINNGSESNSLRLSPLVLALPPPPTATAAVTGYWDVASTWGGAAIDDTYNLEVPSGATVTIRTNVTCASLTIQSGGAVIFENGSSLTVTGDLIIVGSLTAYSGSLITVGGSWTNNGVFAHMNGTVQLSSASGTISGASSTSFNNLNIVGSSVITQESDFSVGNLTIDGSLIVSSSQTISVKSRFVNNGSFSAGDGMVEFSGSNGSLIGGSQSTTFNQLEVNVGADVNDILTVTSSLVIEDLILTKGLIRFQGASTDIKELAPILSTAGLELNGAGSVLTTHDQSITNEGLIRIVDGTANFGNSSGNSIKTQSRGAFIVSGGTVNIAGKLHSSAYGTVAGTGIDAGITISGGTINLATVGNGESDSGTLNITEQSNFTFSGGTIVFVEPSTASRAIDLKIIEDVGYGTKSITGGTFQFGNADTGSNATFIVNSEVALSNVTVYDDVDIMLANDLEVGGTLSLSNTSSLNSAGNTVRLAVNDAGVLDFPFVDNDGKDLAVSVDVTGYSAGAWIEVTMKDEKDPNNLITYDYLNRYWDVKTSGITGYDLSVKYLEADITGTEGNIVATTYDGSNWTVSGTLDGTNNTISYTGLSGDARFSSFAEPTIDIFNGATAVICGSAGLRLVTVVTGAADYDYVWTTSGSGSITDYLDNPSAANPVISTVDAGGQTFSVEVTDGNGLTANAQIDVTLSGVTDLSATFALTKGNSIQCQNSTSPEITFTGDGSTTYTFTYLVNGYPYPATGVAPTITVPTGVAGDFVYDLVDVSDGTCTSAIDVPSITITIDPLPIATGGSQTACIYEPVTVTGATAENGTISWSVIVGNGSLTDANSINPIYTPIASDANSTVELEMTVTGLGSCSSATPATASYEIFVLDYLTAPSTETFNFTYDGNAHYGTATPNDPANEVIDWYDAAAGGNKITAPGGIDAGTYTAYAASKNTTTGCESATRTEVVMTINKRLATWTTNNNSKTYGSADPSPITTGSGTNFVASDNITATYSRATGETVGDYHITATLAPSAKLDNYTITNDGATFTINKKTASVTPNAASKTYGDADPAFTGTLSGFMPADNVTAAYNRAAGEDVATYTISATLSPTNILDNYDITYNTAVFTINKRLATWTTNNNSKTYGSADPSPITTGSGTNFVASDNITATYSRVGGETVGDYHITATLAPSAKLDNYTITNDGATFTINKKTASVTPNAASKTYGDADPTFTGTLSGFMPADNVTAAYNRTAGEDVATYTISATLSPTNILDNYDITYNTAVFTINKRLATWTTNNNSKTYGSADPSPITTGSGTNFVASDNITATYSRVGGETVGDYHITATLAPSTKLDNYTITNDGATFTINKKTASVTPNAAIKTYGDADPTFTGTLSGFMPADNVTAAYNRTAGEDVATYTISATLSPTGILDNYDITYNTAVFTINKRLATWTTNNNSKTYGSADPSPITTGSGTNFVASDNITATYSRATGETVGDYHITATLAPSAKLDNYTITNDGATFTINKKTASVTPNAASKTYGDADPAFTGTLSGFMPADNVTAAYNRAAGEDVATYTISATLSPTNILDNYDITYNTAVFTINKRLATWTTNNNSKTYGSADPSPITTGSGTNFVASDNITATYSRVGGETVGDYHITATLAPSAKLDNYTITNDGATFTINKKTASVTPNAASKTYGDADPTFTGTLSGFMPADNVTAAYNRTAGEDVATYTISATLSPTNILDNYDITYNTAVFTINKRLATWTTNNNSKTYGSADPSPITTGSGTNFVASDNITATYSRVGGETVGDYHITATLAPSTKLDNYTITNDGATFTINKKTASVTPNAAIKTYGDADPTFTGTLSGFMPADNVTAAYNRTAGEDVATYTISATLSPTGILDNYDITYNTAVFTINKRLATWTTNNNSKTYGSADPSPITTGSGTNFVASDNITATYSRVGGETVGDYHITATLAPSAKLDNYTITNDGATFTINKKTASVTPNAASKTYGDADPAFTGTLSGFMPADNVTAAYNRAAGEDVATYTISATLSPTNILDNYDITYNTAVFTINKRLATWTTNNNSKTYGSADPSPITTGSGTNFVASDNITATYSRATGETVGDYHITATLAPSAKLDNYTITNDGATFTINKKTASVTPNAASKTYGDADPTFTGTLSGFMPADNVTAAYNRTAGEDVATYTISATLSPTNILDNYDITYNTAVFTINKRLATWTTNNNSKTYGSADPSPITTGSGTNFVASDNITATYSRATGETVGDYHITATLAPSAKLDNYTITNDGATFTITPAPLTPTITAENKCYDGTTTAILSKQDLIGIVGTDDVSLVVGASNFDNANAGTGKTVTATGLTLGGADASNYSLSAFTATTTADIYELPVPAITGDLVFCENTSGTYSTESGMSSYTWDVTGGTIAGGIGTSTITVDWGAAGTGTVSVNYINSNGCTANVPTEISTTINLTPSVSDPSDQVVCNGSSTTAVSFSGNGTSYSWTNSEPGIGLAASGDHVSGIGAFTATNTGSSPVEATIVVTPHFLNGGVECDGASKTFTITVNPTPVLSSPLTDDVCSGSLFSYMPTSETEDVDFTWTRQALTGITNAQGEVTKSGSGLINETLINLTATNKTVTYVIGMSANGCANTQSLTVTVFPAPGLLSSLTPPSVCSGSVFSYIAVPSVSGTSMNWHRPVVDGISNPEGNGVNNISETLVNTTNNTINVPYTYTLTANGCTSTRIVTVAVKPTATVNAIDDQVYCKGDIVLATALSGPVSGTTFTWTNNNTAIGLAASGAGPASVPSFTANSNNLSAPITATITVRPTANGCVGTSLQYQVKVNPLPTATITATDNSVCVGEAASVTFTGSRGTAPYTFTYRMNTGSSQTVQTVSGNSVSVPVDTSTDGNFTYQLISVRDASSTACEQPQSGSTTITVNPLPTASITGDNTVCQGAVSPVITFTGANGTRPYTFTYRINSGAEQTVATSSISNTATVSVPTTAAGDFTYELLRVTDVNTCGQDQSGTATVTVSPRPTATIAIDETAVCQGETAPVITFTGSGGAAPYTFTYKYNNGVNQQIVSDGSGIATINQSTATSGTFTYSLVAVSGDDGCGQNQSGSVSVTVNPTPDASISANVTEVCQNGTPPIVTFTGTVGTAPFTFEYSIDGVVQPLLTTVSGNSRVVNPPTNVTGDFTYRLISVTDGSSTTCSQPQTDELTITVKPLPTATIAASSNSGCLNGTEPVITFTGLGGTEPYTFRYRINGGAIQTTTTTGSSVDVSVPTTSTGTYVYKLESVESDNGCSNSQTSSQTVIIYPLPTASISGTTTVCRGDASLITFTGSGSTAPYTFTYNIDGGAEETVTTTSGNTATVVAANSADGSFTYNLVRVQGATGCSQDQSGKNATVTVNPLPTATIAGTTSVCQDDAEPAITFTGSGGTRPYTFSYSVDGGANQMVTTTGGNDFATVDVPTTTSGTFTYELVSVRDASSTACEQPQPGIAEVTINQKPVLTSSPTPTGICGNTQFSYTPVVEPTGTTLEWERLDISGVKTSANSGQDGIDETLELETWVTDPIPVTYTYTLTSPDGCANTQEVIVMVTPTPVLTNTASPVCSGSMFNFVPESNVSGTTFSWSRPADAYNAAASGTGNINEPLYNTSSNPISVTYTFQLRSNDCVNPSPQYLTVTVMPAPEVTAFASETTICPGESVDLFSSSNIAAGLPTTILSEGFNGGPNGWTDTYSSGDADAAWTLRPNGYYYNSPGPGGVTFHSNDNSQFYLSNNDDQGGNTTTNLISPQFSTDGYTSATLTFWHYYRDGGGSDNARIQWSQTGTGGWSNLDSYSSSRGSSNNFVMETVTLPVGEPSIYIRFNYQANNDYWWAIDNVTITGEPQSQATILWTSNTSTWTSEEANPTNVTPTETTTYTVTYTDPDLDCPGTAYVTVNVRPEPEVEITANYCTGNGMVELSATEGFSSYLWSTGETTQSIEVGLAGFYEVTVTDVNGCTGYQYITVHNNLVVNSDFSAGNTAFTTGYGYRANVAGQSELYPEGLYGVGANANNYHTNFWGHDHTTGTGNFMIVNGNTNAGTPIWEQTVSVEPNTNYYFSAWAMSLNNVGNDAVLQFEVNGELVGTTGRLPAGVSNNSNNGWIRFYSDILWNSGSISGPITIRIKNVEPAASGNDFGIDDISFGTLDATPFAASPTANTPCEGETLEIMANVTGGNAPITYEWTLPDGSTSNELNLSIPNATEANEGTYTINLVDAFGCPISAQVNVSVNPVPSVTAPQNTSTCSGTAFDFTAPGVPAGTNYTWTAPTGTGFTGGSAQSTPQTSVSQTLVNTTSSPVTATYLVTPTAGPCLGETFTLEVRVDPAATVDAGEPQQVCAGSSIILDGSIDGAATAASWSAPSGSFSDVNSLTSTYTPSISSGTVTLTLTTSDPAGDCPAVLSTVEITVTEPPIASLVSQTDILCKGAATGAIDASVTGGQPPYSYFWNTGATTPDIANLTAGIYTLTVTDANNCTDQLSVTITEPEQALTATISDVVNETCVETYNGKATVTASGGTGNYLYSWNTVPEQTDPTATLLASGTYTVTVTDENGCVATADVTIVIEVNTPPEITQCPADADLESCTITDIDGLAYSETIVEITEAQFTAAGGLATDNCGIIHYYYTDAQSGTCPIEVIRTFTVEDAGGLTDDCSQRITFDDNTAPSWTTAAGDLDRTLMCDDASGISAAQALVPVATDNCDADVTHLVKVSGGFAPGGCPQAGTYTNTWTVTDECGNTSDVFTQVITIVDNDPPTWVTAEGALDENISCNDPAALAAAQELFPTAVDKCDGNVTNIVKVEGNFVSDGSCPQNGTITNTWTVADDCGNVSVSYTQIITIADTEAPEWVSYEGELNITVDCNDAAGLAAAQLMEPVADDNCGLDPATLVRTPGDFVPSLDCPQAGTYTNTWTINDLCGNPSAIYTQTITVVDDTEPVIVAPAPVAIECSDSSHPDDTGWPYAYDECTDVNDINFFYSDGDPIPGSCEGNYTFVRNWTAIDDCGNYSSITQNITVQDVTPPVWTTPLGSLNRTVSCDDPTALANAQALFPLATDNCSTPVRTLVSDETTYPDPDCPNTYTRIRTWISTDDCGNESEEFVQTITVDDTMPPAWKVESVPSYSYCVERLFEATYNGLAEPDADILEARPDYYIFQAHDTDFDLDPATYFLDNCSDLNELILHWQITVNSTGDYLRDASDNELNNQTGQPSTHPVNIVFPGAPAGKVYYTIIYWLEDECGNVSQVQSGQIEITPRPQIIKMNDPAYTGP